MAIAGNFLMLDNQEMPTHNKIKALRAAQGITSEQLAERIGVSQSLMSRLESGKRQITEDYVFRLCDNLHCTPNEIFGFSAAASPLNTAALEFSINLALEVSREMPGDLTDGHIVEAVLFLYGEIVKDGLLQEKEPRRTVRAMTALKEHLSRAQA